MAKAPRTETSSTPFPFVRQFTSPPFFVDIEDAKLKSQLLLDAVQHVGPPVKKTPAKRKAVKPANKTQGAVKQRAKTRK